MHRDTFMQSVDSVVFLWSFSLRTVRWPQPNAATVSASGRHVQVNPGTKTRLNADYCLRL